jgi:hypothetical protein
MGVALFLAAVGENALPAALAAAGVARQVLLYAAILPFAAYLVFLFANLVLNLWHAVLSLPGKLDLLAESSDPIGRGQPDTVTTHE